MADRFLIRALHTIIFARLQTQGLLERPRKHLIPWLASGWIRSVVIPPQKQERGSEVKTEAPTYTPRKYEKVDHLHNEACWNGQGGSRAGLKLTRKEVGLGFYGDYGGEPGCGFSRVAGDWRDLNFLLIPKEEDSSFLITLLRCGQRGHGRLESCQKTIIETQSLNLYYKESRSRLASIRIMA